jgi:hypothetical protein
VENMKRWLSFKNESGEEIPPYAVIMLQSDTTADPNTINYLGRLLFVQPDDVDDGNKTFALNSASPVGEDEYGKCVFGIDAPVWGRIESDSGNSTWDVTDTTLDWVGQEWGPVDGRWDVNIGGTGFIIQGPPDIDNNRILVRQKSIPAVEPIPEGDCDCCPGCVCYPEDEDDITDDCGAIGCLLKNYRIVANLPFSGTTTLAWVSGCIFETASFNVTLCEDEDYGDHFWRLTVGAGIGDSTLELINDGGTDIPVEYVSQRPFRMLCATEFVFKENCAIYADDYLKSIGHTWPTKLCINPVGDDSCVPCELPSVVTLCCPDGTPSTLTGTLSDFSNTSGFTGTFSLVHDPARLPAFGGAWYGTISVCSTTYEFQLHCCLTPAGDYDWYIQYAAGSAGCGGGSITTIGSTCNLGHVATSETCNPLEILFDVGIPSSCPCNSTGAVPGVGHLAVTA